ncbi:hypothetical protein ACHAW5_001195 [Stephanodiscus triporus]|uniref:Formamidopyrimidine-DNA glycosylase H2TH DNA-binding domain-containing protein n=1 Tax=Stephanodiscus triporus TaxID=2934178 RepID=A0ABD3NJE2_9STRA
MMVEGHSVHRLATAFRLKLVGRKFAASSPNGRFAEGAAAIRRAGARAHGGGGEESLRVLRRRAAMAPLTRRAAAMAMATVVLGVVGAVASRATTARGGEGDIVVDDADVVVVHVHFGMSGAWAIYDMAVESEPETKPTTRLRLEEIKDVVEGDGRPSGGQKGGGDNVLLVTHLSAMTVSHGPSSLYVAKRASLGQDPLRCDADPDWLYGRVSKSKKSIGTLIMDQSHFAGPGNIYRAEILFLAGVHPTTPGSSLDRATFDGIWNACVALLRRGYDTGSILTVDATIDPDAYARGERRSWDMSGRTCYACEGGTCQPRIGGAGRVAGANERRATEEEEEVGGGGEESPRARHAPFISRCAPVGRWKRLQEGGASNLTVAEIRSAMLEVIGGTSDDDVDNVDVVADNALLPNKNARKSVHVEALELLLERQRRRKGRRRGEIAGTPPLRSRKDRLKKPPVVATSTPLPPPRVSAEDAAREKLVSGENRAIEHVVELSREQAMRALLTVTPSPAMKRGRRRDEGMRNNSRDEEDDDNLNDGMKERTSRRRRRLNLL